MNKKIRNLIILFIVHLLLWVFVLSKLNLGLLYYLWGYFMALIYSSIIERND